MKKDTLRLACAVNSSGGFEEKHFSKADRFLIYEWIDDEFIFIKEEINTYKRSDEEPGNVSADDCVSISDLLKVSDVSVLVSKQFGKSIHMVNHMFIPVVVSSASMNEVISILKKHIRWIKDELIGNTSEFKLFIIKNGILKTSVQKDN
jgi:predicted Fe-Mo cluster-binding NifX family protein